MALHLHNPTNQAHLEDLKDRLSIQLACAGSAFSNGDPDRVLMGRLVRTVRSMDEGIISTESALEEFTRAQIPGFSFAKWLADMVDEGVYLDTRFNKAA